MSTWVIVALVGGLVIGAVIGWLLGQYAAAGLRVTAATATAQRDATIKRLADGERDRDALIYQFKAWTAQTLAEQTQRDDLVANDRLARTQALLAPVNEALVGLRDRLTRMETERAAMSAQLSQQVTDVVATSEHLRQETFNLATALRKPQVRGSWGETQLRRVVEIAGLVDHIDFVEQETTAIDGNRSRPDMKVMLGGGKFCYVDSKVPLTAFLEAQQASGDGQRVADLARFAANVRTHIDQLSAKAYWKAGLGSPEFVALFIPSDALYAEALAQAPDLMEYAANRNIILTTPTSLIGLLRAVAYGWKQAQLADTAAEVANLGGELYDRLATLSQDVGELGHALTSTVTSYNKMVGSLEQRVLVTTRRIGKLQAAADIARPSTVDDPVRSITRF